MKLNKKFWDRFQILFYEYDYQKLAKMVSRGMSRDRQQSYAKGFDDGVKYGRKRLKENND